MESVVLRPRLAGNGTAVPTERGWKLTIPPGDGKSYRLAQVDDYGNGRRAALPWRPPTTIDLKARVSAMDLPGTWGFGLWNNPFGLACGPTSEALRLPTLPHSAWFFAASARNHLSLRDTGPANGFFAQVYSSRRVGAWLMRAAVTLPISAASARRTLARDVREDAAAVTADPREWHSFQILWDEISTAFAVDGHAILKAALSPRPPLGLVIWIDNQFARFDVEGRSAWGVEACSAVSWLEIEDLTVQGPAWSRTA